MYKGYGFCKHNRISLCFKMVLIYLGKVFNRKVEENEQNNTYREKWRIHS